MLYLARYERVFHYPLGVDIRIPKRGCRIKTKPGNKAFFVRIENLFLRNQSVSCIFWIYFPVFYKLQSILKKTREGVMCSVVVIHRAEAAQPTPGPQSAVKMRQKQKWSSSGRSEQACQSHWWGIHPTWRSPCQSNPEGSGFSCMKGDPSQSQGAL